MSSTGEVRIRRLDPVHDPEAYARAMLILGSGLRRALFKAEAVSLEPKQRVEGLLGQPSCNLRVQDRKHK